MRVLPRHRMNTFRSLLTIGAGFILVGSVSDDAPPRILPDVTIQNDASNSVPVSIRDPVPVQDQESVGCSCFVQR